MPLVLRIGFGLMHCTEGVLRRCIERIELQRSVTHIDNIVPRTCGNEDGIITVHACLLLQIISATAHIYLGSAVLYTNKLVNVRVHLYADVAANGNAQ